MKSIDTWIRCKVFDLCSEVKKLRLEMAFLRRSFFIFLLSLTERGINPADCLRRLSRDRWVPSTMKRLRKIATAYDATEDIDDLLNYFSSLEEEIK